MTVHIAFIGGQTRPEEPKTFVRACDRLPPYEETWTYECGDDGCDSCIRNQDDCTIQSGEGFYSDERGMLAAAAPDLYRALDALLTELAGGYDVNSEAVTLSLAALKKARGES